MGSTLTNLMYHAVFSTKNRLPMILNEFEADLYAYIGGIIKKEGGIPLAIGGMNDHIHLLIKLKPRHALANVMRVIKGNASKWINQKEILLGRFSWQEGYGAFTVSESQLRRTVHYVGNQREHHQGLTFEQEYMALLEKH